MHLTFLSSSREFLCAVGPGRAGREWCADALVGGLSQFLDGYPDGRVGTDHARVRASRRGEWVRAGPKLQTPLES